MRMWKRIEKNSWGLAFWGGILAVGVFCLAYPVLGSKCYVQFTDQLDGEVINYLYNAKYLFSANRIVPEFMSGADISSMTPPTLLGVLFYRILPPFQAFACMHIFSVTVGYVGMFLLLRSLVKNPMVVFAVSCLFVYLPFYPVYGLTVLGQPLLVWAFLCIRRGEGKLRHYLSIALYAVGSSVVLAGFSWLAIGAVWLLVLYIRREKCRKQLSAGYTVLLLTDMLCNIRLLTGYLGKRSYGATHREEMVTVAIPDIWDYFWNLFFEGGLYVKSYNRLIAAAAVAVIVWKLLEARIKKQKLRLDCRALMCVLAANFLIALGASLWRTETAVGWRTKLGGILQYFQFDRVYWLLPLGWYVILALVSGILLEHSEGAAESQKVAAGREEDAAGYRNPRSRRWELCRGLLCCGAAMALLLAQAYIVYPKSSIWHNLRLMIFPDTYHLMTWDDYYAEDVFAQIEKAIGREKSEYRVASMGINPAAALYSGFYCIDGYSNLYSLEYKHEFRRIIEKELEKNSEVAVYFDTWGNRCYLFNSETGNYMTLRKGSGSYENVELDIGQLRKMGVEYLFSAMPMDNAGTLGLTLLPGSPFETAESYYEIWVYELK